MKACGPHTAVEFSEVSRLSLYFLASRHHDSTYREHMHDSVSPPLCRPWPLPGLCVVCVCRHAFLALSCVRVSAIEHTLTHTHRHTQTQTHTDTHTHTHRGDSYSAVVGVRICVQQTRQQRLLPRVLPGLVTRRDDVCKPMPLSAHLMSQTDGIGPQTGGTA